LGERVEGEGRGFRVRVQVLELDLISVVKEA